MTSEPSLAASEPPAAHPSPEQHAAHGHAAQRFWPLVLGSIGVVFGDIGTSPLYAFRDALAEIPAERLVQADILGVLSLALWALILVVTAKYVLFLMRADNNGEGGVLSLMALAQRGLKSQTVGVFALGAIGAALFYGDGVITPAISVLSAVEGMKSVRGFSHWFGTEEVIIVTLLILTALFAYQSHGTAKVGRLFGPVMVIWFLGLGAMGLMHIKDSPGVLAAVSPTYAVVFLLKHQLVGFLVLGAVFLTVTGAEALTADMGHFGRLPIQAAWFALVFPCLALNYFGQAAVASKALAHAHAMHQLLDKQDWFFLMAPPQFRIGWVVMAAVATVIASQAVITGAFSLTQQAIQLGLLPRMNIKITSATEAGQIYVAPINWLLFVGVVLLVLSFRSSDALAHAYGISVTGTMVVTTCLAFIVVRRCWNWKLPLALAVLVPLLALDLTFFTANLLKVLTGGWVPLMLGGGLCLVMATWVQGTRQLRAKLIKEGLPLADFLKIISQRAPGRVAGTAVYLTSEPATTPAALMHSMKHYRVLHEKNVMLRVVNESRPFVDADNRVEITDLGGGFWYLIVRYGYMETPNIPKALTGCRKLGLKFDIMATTFFLSRRAIVASSASKLPAWRRQLYVFMMKNAADPTSFFHLPPGRVVELGTQVSI
ncbi:MAG TPA: potassium transporter Kup [Phenylobacterium sp.]|uniref:potassium transporter Kup n=1 Tax=Phenylobacterium sp. TaxID=1871053 RepID=UPI002B474F90|nr:potassium transporter Kup [Phenylobacterium sp.]HKR88370.1 potassium transporter Kup [Phenylobacterium sp.]